MAPHTPQRSDRPGIAVALLGPRSRPRNGEESESVSRRADLDDLGPAHITFSGGRTGELQLTAIAASIDYRLVTRDGSSIAEFSWAGDDHGSPISGRGWARRTADGLVGRLLIHEGDEAELVAKRVAKR